MPSRAVDALRASKVHEAAVSVILVLVAEIVIKLQREMDAKIGLDTNYHGGGTFMQISWKPELQSF